MKNYTQKGDVITVAAPADVASGDFVAIGALYGVAQTNAATGDDVALVTSGVFELPVANGSGLTAGDRVYVANGALTADADTGGEDPVAHERAGVAVDAAFVQNGTAYVAVKLG